jgi:hypothetical protein
MALRPFTLSEWAAFTLAAARVRDEIDRELGEALLCVARGDDGALARVYDRLLILGEFAGADRLRALCSPRAWG